MAVPVNKNALEKDKTTEQKKNILRPEAARCNGPAVKEAQVAVVFQRYIRDALAGRKAGRQAILVEMDEHLQEPPGSSGPPEAWHQSSS